MGREQLWGEGIVESPEWLKSGTCQLHEATHFSLLKLLWVDTAPENALSDRKPMKHSDWRERQRKLDTQILEKLQKYLLTSSQSRTQCPPHPRVSLTVKMYLGFPGSANGKEPACQCRIPKRRGFHPWIRKILWSRKWQPTPVFLPGKFHGQRSLEGYSLWGHKESDMT